VLDLSPTKLVVILVVAVVLLGPKRLPQVARQLGAGWRRVREVSRQIDQEVRHSIPDLPSSQDIVRFARSPVTLLNQLADMPATPPDALVEDPGAPAPPEGHLAVVGDGAGHDGAGHDGAGHDGAGHDGAGRDGAPSRTGGTPWGPDAAGPVADDPNLN
jgi:TatA/E family protein of Tat protein translocase